MSGVGSSTSDDDDDDRSRLVLWDSKTIHCNYSTSRTPEEQRTDTALQREVRATVPVMHRPEVFHAVDQVAEWTKFLQEQGFVVLRGALVEEDGSIATGEDGGAESSVTPDSGGSGSGSGSEEGTGAARLLNLLRGDLRALNQNPELRLDEVQECWKRGGGSEYSGHLPTPRNNHARWSLGLVHGRFAWAVRRNEGVRAVFARLHGSDDLSSSIDATFLSPARGDTPHDDQNDGALWLHTDQNPNSAPVQNPQADKPPVPLGTTPMWQSVLHVYAAPGADGCGWERIGQSVCYAPRAQRGVVGASSAFHQKEGRGVPKKKQISAERQLLAMCVSGDPSSHWPQLGLKLGNGRAVGMGAVRFAHLKRIPCQLNPALSDRAVAAVCAGKNGLSSGKSKVQTVGQLRELTLGALTGSALSDAELRAFVHPDYLRCIGSGQQTTNDDNDNDNDN